jgi:glycosyltransferase involved in cell wall biosynthesis
MMRASGTHTVRCIAIITREYQPRVTTGDAPDMPRGGIARAMSMHAHALAGAGVEEVHVITLSPDNLSSTFRDGPVFVHRIPDPGVVTPPDMAYVRLGIWSHRVSARYAELDAEVGFDVVEAPDWYGETLHLGHRPETPVVVSLHALTAVIGLEQGRPRTPGDRAWDALELLAVEGADHVLAPTQRILDSTHALLGDRLPPASLIPLPFDANRFPARGQQPRWAGPITLTFVGRIERLKGVDLALRVTAAARSRGLVVRLEVLGRAEPAYLESVIRPLQAELDLHDVDWAGELSEQEVARRLRTSDCALLPSRSENFHMAAVEALSSALPVITTDRNGLTKWFSREHGLLALPVENDEAYVQAAVDGLMDLEWLDTAGPVGAARVRELLDPQRVARQVLSVYEGILQSQSQSQRRAATAVPASDAGSDLHEDALQAFSEGRWADARELAVGGFERDGTIEHLNDLAVILVKVGRSEAAKVLLSACLVVRPGDVDALANLQGIDELPGRVAEVVGTHATPSVGLS